MNKHETLLKCAKENGVRKPDRTDTVTITVFQFPIRFNFKEEFPLLKTKFSHVIFIIYKLFWFLKGSINIYNLRDYNLNKRDEWTNGNSELGRIYSFEGRYWLTSVGNHINQFDQVMELIKTNLDSHNFFLSVWNFFDMPKIKLPVCPTLSQFYSVEGKLSGRMIQKSADFFLGVTYKKTSYKLLSIIFAHVYKLKLKEYDYTLIDTTSNLINFEEIDLQLGRQDHPYPKMFLNQDVRNIFNLKYGDIKLKGYYSHSLIKAPIAT